jgi:hypothetical protein
LISKSNVFAIRAGFLLKDDANRLINEAQESKVLK